MQLSEYGIITDKHINAIGENYEHLMIQKYVIMPNHIHLLISVSDLKNKTDGTSRTPSPTNAVIPVIVSTLKRFVHKDCGFVLFQRSYHDHIVRDDAEYRRIWKYIDENPMKWEDDLYHV